MISRTSIAMCVLGLSVTDMNAATLRGRVKDQQCTVLANVTVRIRATNTTHGHDLRTLITDDGGNYTAELPAGVYEVCVKRGSNASACTGIEMPASGDKWMTTQLRDAAPDLSNLGNRSY